MNENQLAAYIMGQVAAAMIEAMGMHAENMQRQHLGQSVAYQEDSFAQLQTRYTINHNDVIGFYQRHQ